MVSSGCLDALVKHRRRCRCEDTVNKDDVETARSAAVHSSTSFKVAGETYCGLETARQKYTKESNRFRHQTSSVRAAANLCRADVVQQS